MMWYSVSVGIWNDNKVFRFKEKSHKHALARAFRIVKRMQVADPTARCELVSLTFGGKLKFNRKQLPVWDHMGFGWNKKAIPSVLSE